MQFAWKLFLAFLKSQISFDLISFHMVSQISFSFDTTGSNSQISFDFIRYQISSHLNLKSHISFDIIIIIFKHINSRGSKLLLISFTFGKNFHLQKEKCFVCFDLNLILVKHVLLSSIMVGRVKLTQGTESIFFLSPLFLISFFFLSHTYLLSIKHVSLISCSVRLYDRLLHLNLIMIRFDLSISFEKHVQLSYIMFRENTIIQDHEPLLLSLVNSRTLY